MSKKNFTTITYQYLLFSAPSNIAFKVGNSDIIYKQDIKSGSNNNLNLGDSAIAKVKQTPVQRSFDAAAKVIEGGADILTAPAVWLKDMQQNWLSYMVVAAIILLSIAFLYCVVRSYFARKSNNLSLNNLAQLATIITNKDKVLQGQLHLPPSNSSSTELRTIGGLRV